MSKRFTDSCLPDKEWWQLLPLELKVLWEYLRATCDAAGVWTPNYRQADFVIGAKIDWDGAKDLLAKHIEILPNGKWWLSEYCDFQYGKLTEDCRPHRPVIALLKKHGLYDRVLVGYQKGTNTLEDKDKEKEKDKEKDKDGGGEKKRFVPPTPAEVEEYGKSIGYAVNGQKFVDHYETVGWVRGKSQVPIKSWRAAVRTWKSRDVGGVNAPTIPEKLKDMSNCYEDKR